MDLRIKYYIGEIDRWSRQEETGGIYISASSCRYSLKEMLSIHWAISP